MSNLTRSLMLGGGAAWTDQTGTALRDPQGRPVFQPRSIDIQRLRLVTDFFAGTGVALTAVTTGGSTSALNTSVGSSGETPYGKRAWRLTTTNVNGNAAAVRVTRSSGGYLKNVAMIDPSLPFIVVIQPHTINGGSRLRVYLSGTDASAAGARMTSDMYISSAGTRLSGELPDPVIPVVMGPASFAPSVAATAPIQHLVSMQIEAYQEGTANITDFTILGVYQAKQRPCVHMGFDDGLFSVYENAFPIMQSLGLVGSFAVMGDATYGTDSGSRTAYTNLPLMIKPEMDAMLAAGWEATTHGTQAVSGLTYAQCLARVQAQRAGVDALGPAYAASSDFYAYPGGATNFTADGDGQPIGFKALAAAGFKHARLTSGVFGSGAWSDALSGLGAAALFQNSLAVNYLRAPATSQAETADPAGKLQGTEAMLNQLLSTGGMLEMYFHNVVPRAVVNGGQPYIGSGYTGTASNSNDTSTELFTDIATLIARYRDLGLIDVVLKRDWWSRVPTDATKRAAMRRIWTS